jgi:hypothetical protein
MEQFRTDYKQASHNFSTKPSPYHSLLEPIMCSKIFLQIKIYIGISGIDRICTMLVQEAQTCVASLKRTHHQSMI